MRAPAPRPSNANRSSCVQSILQRGGTCGPPTDLLSHGRFSRCGAAGPTAAAPKRLKGCRETCHNVPSFHPQEGLATTVGGGPVVCPGPLPSLAHVVAGDCLTSAA